MALSGLSGHHIRAARLSLNWKLTDMAERTGISTVTLSHFETGQKKFVFGSTETGILAACAKAGVRFYRSDGVRCDLLGRHALLRKPFLTSLYTRRRRCRVHGRCDHCQRRRAQP